VKTAMWLCLLVVAGLGTGCAGPRTAREPAALLPAVRAYVEATVAELDRVPPERQAVLHEIAAVMVEELRAGREAKVTFICTHNSRRSHMSQIWLQTAAAYYSLDRVRAFSGGTEVTACNCRTVTAMRRAGFVITDVTRGENPVYHVTYASNRPPVRAWSKHYRAGGNPRAGFIALMTCSAADRSCPAIEGALARFAIHYTDPRLCDDTPTESAAYDARCREIAREMFFLAAEVRQQTHPE
jgi:arsenate reductase